jgi:hypothetical protein
MVIQPHSSGDVFDIVEKHIKLYKAGKKPVLPSIVIIEGFR